MDLRQTHLYARFLEKIHWIVEIDEKTKAIIYVRKLPGTPFCVIKIQRPQTLPTKDVIWKLVQKHQAIQVNIEPLTDAAIPALVRWRFVRQTIPFLPSNTILVDLSLPEDVLKLMMKQKTRYNLKTATRLKVQTKIFDGMELLHDSLLFDALFTMQQQNARRLGIFVLPKKWFRHQVESLGRACFAAMAYIDDVLVAATFYMTSDTTVYYSHNGSLPQGRATFAPTACVWAGMMEGKKRGLRYFDFEGIYDYRSRVIRWQGFTRFKQGFGGRQHFFPGLYSKWVWPF